MIFVVTIRLLSLIIFVGGQRDHIPARRWNGSIEHCEIVQKLLNAGVDSELVAQWTCMAESLSQGNTSSLQKNPMSLDSNPSNPCQRYTLGLFQIPNSWCSSEDHDEFSQCTRNGCTIDCLKLLDSDISDDIECIKLIHNISQFSPWSQTIVSNCRRGIESNQWNYTTCLNERRKRSRSITTISLWVAVLLVAVTSLVVFGLTYFFYKYRRNSHSILSNQELRDFKYGRIRGIPSVFRFPTIRLSHYNQDEFHDIPYNNEYEIPSCDFAIEQNCRLGSGAYGVVYKAICKGRVVAAKTVNPYATKDYLQSLLGEIKILSHIGRHNCIVNMEGAFTKDLQKGILYVFMEFCGMGSLEKFLRINKNKYVTLGEPSLRNTDDELKFDEDVDSNSSLLKASSPEVSQITLKHLLQYAHQIAKGMEFLSSKKVLHGDLAARNILLVDENTAKIADFGLSRKLYGYVQYIKKKEEPLPWRWMAIESLKEMNFSTSSDAWMYGVCLFEIFSLGEVPYPGLSWSLEFVDKLENGFRMLRPKYAPVNVYKDVMLKCWEAKPDERPSFSDLSNYFYKSLQQITSIDYTEVVENTCGGSHTKSLDEYHK